MKLSWLSVILILVGLIQAPAAVQGADRIVLRNLNIISDRTVASLDPDGVRLDDGRQIGWDSIEQGRVSSEFQAEFDRLLKSLGEPLYRIRQRLSVGDVRGLHEHAEAVYPSFVGRRSQTAYMVCQSLMWSRLAMGQREAAVEPYLRCFDYLRTVPEDQVQLPGNRRLTFDRETGLTRELRPVWFDTQAAKLALPGVYQAVADLQPPRPEGTRVYYGTLAVAGGEWEMGQKVLGGIQSDTPSLLQLRDIGLAQAEVESRRPGPALQRLAATYRDMSPGNLPLAVYWLGVANSQSEDAKVRDLGVLQLLRLPGLHARAWPELAAAGLFESMQTFSRMGDTDSLSAVRRELLAKYPQSYHATQVKQQLSPKQDP